MMGTRDLSLARTVLKALLTGGLGRLQVGRVAAWTPSLPESGPPPLFLVDSPFDPPALTRVYVVDPTTGVMTLRADPGNAYTPALALAAASETVLYSAATD